MSGAAHNDRADGTRLARRRRIIRDAVGVGAATGAYAVTFGAAASTAGFGTGKALAMSTLMFTGGSQFALVSVIAAGGSSAAAISVAWLLGARNALYAIRLRDVLPLRRRRRVIAAHLVLDESMAMSVARPDPAEARLAFWATGLSIFLLWNLGTLFGATATSFVADPDRFGLDVAFPAAYLALIWPQIRGRAALVTAVTAGVIALVLIPLVPAGVPILAATVGAGFGMAAVRMPARPRRTARP